MRRRKEEAKDPQLKAERLAKKPTKTLDQKRVWDDGDEDSLYTSADVAAVKRRRMEEEEQKAGEAMDEDDEEEEDDLDSMLGSGDEEEDGEEAVNEREARIRAKRSQREPSAVPSTTSTNFDITPAALSAKFPTLFSNEPPPVPKVLITTSINSTLHKEARLFMSLFPNSEYIPRSGHRYSHKYSVREVTFVLTLSFNSMKSNLKLSRYVATHRTEITRPCSCSTKTRRRLTGSQLFICLLGQL